MGCQVIQRGMAFNDSYGNLQMTRFLWSKIQGLWMSEPLAHGRLNPQGVLDRHEPTPPSICFAIPTISKTWCTESSIFDEETMRSWLGMTHLKILPLASSIKSKIVFKRTQWKRSRWGIGSCTFVPSDADSPKAFVLLRIFRRSVTSVWAIAGSRLSVIKSTSHGYDCSATLHPFCFCRC